MDYVESVAFSPDGGTLASGSRDATVRLWDVNTSQVKTILTEQGLTDEWGAVWSVVFSPDGNTLASGSNDLKIRLWDVNTSQVKIAIHIPYASSVAFSPDGNTLASGGIFGGVFLWDVNSGQPKTYQEEALQQAITSVELLPTGSAPKMMSLPPLPVGVTSVAFWPDDSTLISGHTDGTIRLRDIGTGQIHTTLKNPDHLSSVAFSPDGKTLAIWGGMMIQLWDVETGQLKATVKSYDDVWSVAFSPDGHTLASLNGDGTILLWDVASYIAPSISTAIQYSAPPLPTQTTLLANFPNPFNPDTYIPYQLHEPTHARLIIYDIRGALIREIDLGYRAAGQYLTSTNAAHWDGRDHRGQRVASGVYLYQLQAGPVTHVRKMILVK